MDKQPRWERDAERVREAGPAWLDMEWLPWWLFVALGVLFIAFGIDSLLSGDSTFQRVGGFGMLLLVAPAQFLAAYRRHRGIPVMTPVRFHGRFRQP